MAKHWRYIIKKAEEDRELKENKFNFLLHSGGDQAHMDHIESDNFSEDEYIRTIMGENKHIDIDNRYDQNFLVKFQNSKFNTPEINDKLIDKMYSLIADKKKEAESDGNKELADIYEKIDEAESGSYINEQDFKVYSGGNGFKHYGLEGDVDSDGEVNVRAINVKANIKMDIDEEVKTVKTIAEHFNLSSRKITDLISNSDYELPWTGYSAKKDGPIGGVLNNKNIKPEHLYQWVNKHPEKADMVLDHELADERLFDLAVDSPEKIGNMSELTLQKYTNKYEIRDADGNVSFPEMPYKRKLDILNHATKGGLELGTIAYDGLIKELSGEDREGYINKKLGIEGGMFGNAFDTTDDTNWGNWNNGSDYNESIATHLSKSKFLTDDQAEHIKRHGSFNSKVKLYHNENIDTKHGAEMFKKWSEDQTEHGYDAEELTDYNSTYKDDVYTEDDLPEGIFDDEDYELSDRARDRADELYPYSEWVDDNIDHISEATDISDMGDNFTEIVDDRLREDYDWFGENPASKQNVGNTEFDALNKLHEAYKDDNNITLDEFRKTTGMEHPKQLELEFDDDDDIDVSDLNDALDKFGGPAKINFDDHMDYSINEHPEYDERYSDIEGEEKTDYIRNNINDFSYDFYDDYYESSGYEEAREDAINEAKKEIAETHYAEMYESSHQDDRFVPKHLLEHIPGLSEISKERKKTRGEGEAREFLNETIKQRDYEHEYGENLQQHELLKDYSDANGGSIDVGRMHKLFPNLKETWKKVFSGKGKMTSDDIQSKIDTIPKKKYDISYGKWDGGKMQNLNGRDQVIFRLDHSDESLAPIKEDSDLYDTFQKIQKVSKRSGHPTRDSTIAWARVDTTDPNHWMIDEVQSDFGKTVTQYLKNQGDDKSGDLVKKIADHHKDWRENLINHVLKTAKKHGAKKVSTHSPDSKASHTGSSTAHSVYKDSYQKVPRKMGFKADEAKNLPITDQTFKGTFNKGVSQYQVVSKMNDHIEDSESHSKQIGLYQDIIHKFPEHAEGATKLLQHHGEMARKHKERVIEYGGTVKDLKQIQADTGSIDYEMSHNNAIRRIKANDPESFYVDHLLEKPVLVSKEDYHQGNTIDLEPKMKKHQLDLVEDLVKFEIILKNSTLNEIREIASLNIDKIEKILDIRKTTGPASGSHLKRFKIIKKAEEDFRAPRTPKFDLPHVDTSEPNMVNADRHGFGGAMNSVPGQRELIHGLDTDFNAKEKRGSTSGMAWTPNMITGERAIVKPASGTIGGRMAQKVSGHLDERGFNAARREVMFHNMANKFFGLGNHVPTTAGFTKQGEDYSAQKQIDSHSLASGDYPTGEVSSEANQAANNSLKTHSVYGSLHKLAMMDYIMGHHDRHLGNFMIGKDHGNTINLIDNGLAFDYEQKQGKDIPGYLELAEHRDMSKGIHPEAAKWLNNLDEKEAMKQWTDHGFEQDHPAVQGFITRLHNIKEFINNPRKRGVLNNNDNLSSVLKQALSTPRKVDFEQGLKTTAPAPNTNFEKGEFTDKIKTGIAAVAMATTLNSDPSVAAQPKQQDNIIHHDQQQKTDHSKDHILKAIAQVESSGGKNTKHEKLPETGIHRGEKAYGKYGITPLLIRETIKQHKDLSRDHGHAVKLRGDDLHSYMDKNPKLEHEIASRHYDRLAKKFGHDPAKIGYAWLNGISGTLNAIKEGKDINNHWHVKKIMNEYDKIKSQK